MPAPASPVTIRTPAKVNLLLAVLERLPDGYHRVEAVLQAVSLYDELTLRAAPSITITCDDPRIPTGEGNLCHRAARLLAERVNTGSRIPGAAIALAKRIPPEAGLGGGSSDAAAALLGLNRLWQLGLGADELTEVAAQIGADVPFFIRGGAALGTRRGDLLTPLPQAPTLHLTLVMRGPGVSTAWAYSRCRPGGEQGASGPMVEALKAGSARAIASVLRNDLEAAVLPERRDIAELKRALIQYGALGALMSGSGAAVFAIFADDKAAQETASVMSKNGIWARAVRTIERGAVFVD